MSDDQDALLLQVSADVRGLEKQMARAIAVVDGGGRNMEKRAKDTAERMERSFSSIKLENKLDVARARGDKEHIAELQKELELERQIARAKAAGMGQGDAESFAKSHVAALESAKRASKQGSLGEALEGTFDRSRLAVLEEGGARLPIFGKSLEALGPAGLVAAGGLLAAAEAAEKVKEATEEIGALKVRADRLGLPVGALQELEYAAKESHVPVEALDESLQNLSGTLGKLQSGVGGAKTQKLAGFLGFTPAELAQYHDAADFLPALAEKIRALPNLAEQVMAAQRFGVEPLLPLLLKGKDAVAELTNEYRRAGVEVGDEFATKVEEGNQALERAHDLAHDKLRNSLAQLQPIIVAIGTAWDTAAGGVLDFINAASRVPGAMAQAVKGGQAPKATIGQKVEGAVVGAFVSTLPLPLQALVAAAASPAEPTSGKPGRNGKAAPSQAQIDAQIKATGQLADLQAELLDHATHRREVEKKIAEIEQEQGHALDGAIKKKFLDAASAQDAKPGRHKADEAAHKAEEAADRIDGLAADLITKTSKSHELEDALSKYAATHGGAMPANVDALRAAAAAKDAEPERQRSKRAQDEVDQADEALARATLEGAQYARDKSDAIHQAAEFEMAELGRQAARQRDQLSEATKGTNPQLDAFGAMQVAAAQGAAQLQQEANVQAKERQALADRQYEQDQQLARSGEQLVQSQLGLALTAAERKRLSENLLALQQQAERDALEHELSTTPGVDPTGAYAQHRRADLQATQAAQNTALGRQNQGPVAAFGQQLQQDVDQPGQKLAVQALQQMNQGLEEGLENWKNMGQAAKGALKSILGDLIKLSLEKAELGASGALGGLMGSAGNGIGSLFSGLWGGAHAAGGSIGSGKVGLVGEKGPELAVGGSAGTEIVPADVTGALLGSMGGLMSGGAAGGRSSQSLHVEEHYHLAGAVSERDVMGMIVRGRADTLNQAAGMFKTGFGAQLSRFSALEN